MLSVMTTLFHAFPMPNTCVLIVSTCIDCTIVGLACAGVKHLFLSMHNYAHTDVSNSESTLMHAPTKLNYRK